MLQLASPQPPPTSIGRDITINVRAEDAADQKGYIAWALRSAIACENRKYLKAKRILSAGPSFSHVRCIRFMLDHPNPHYDEVITYRLSYGATGVIVEPAAPNPDPKVAPLLGPVDLGEVKNDFFHLCDPGSQKATLTAAATGIRKDASLIAMTETRQIAPTRMPSIPSEYEDRPQFRFGGKYLERYGFNIGTPVTVYLEQNKITLTVADDQKTGRQSA